MLLIPTQVKPSKIHGLGLFVTKPIKKNTLLWKYIEDVSMIFIEHARYNAMTPMQQQFVRTYGFLDDKWPEYWMVPFDDTRYFNHSENPTMIYVENIEFSNGAYFATRELLPGDELTEDYRLSSGRGCTDFLSTLTGETLSDILTPPSK